jgi:hypothetical protein
VVLLALFNGYQAVTSLDEFNRKIDVWMEPPASSDAADSYIRGRVLPIVHQPESGRGVGVAPDLYWALPRGVRARTPDEVGTVVWLDWEEKTITGPYNGFVDQVTGIQYVCKVTLIDKRANRKLAERTFRGSDPTGSGRFQGDKPHKEIVDYLKGLPHKAD